MKKLISVLLAVITALSGLPLVAFAVYRDSVGNELSPKYSSGSFFLPYYRSAEKLQHVKAV